MIYDMKYVSKLLSILKIHWVLNSSYLLSYILYLNYFVHQTKLLFVNLLLSIFAAYQYYSYFTCLTVYMCIYSIFYFAFDLKW